MFLKRSLIVAGGLCLASVAFTGVAAAGVPPCYPNCTTGITINDPTAVPGQLLTVTVAELDPGTSASGVVNSHPIVLGAKTVGADGTVSFSFNAPSEVGAHTVTVSGIKGGVPVTLVIPFTVGTGAGGTGGTGGTGSTGGTGGTGGGTALPRTGSDSSLPLTQAGIALLAVGCGAVYVARRRQAPVAA